MSARAISDLERGAHGLPRIEDLPAPPCPCPSPADRAALVAAARRIPWTTRGSKRRSRRQFPVPLTSLIGRDQEILRSPPSCADIGLVTLTGTGGVGKTRLAIARSPPISPTDSRTASPSSTSRSSAIPIRRRLPPSSRPSACLELGDHAAEDRAEAPPPDRHACSWCSTTSSMSLPRAPSSPRSSTPAHASPCSSPVGPSSTSPASRVPVPPLGLPAATTTPSPWTQPPHAPAVQLFVERAQAVQPGLRAHRRERRRRRRDLRPARRPAARYRTRCRPQRGAQPPRDPAAPGAPPAAPDRRPARSPRPPADACATRSPGATTCSTPRSRRFSGASPSSSAAARLRPPSTLRQVMAAADRSPMTPRRWKASRRWSTRACCSDDDTGAWRRLGMLETIREFALEQLAAVGEEDLACPIHAAYFAGLDDRLDPNRVAPGERLDDRLWNIEAELANFRVALTQMAVSAMPKGCSGWPAVWRCSGIIAATWRKAGSGWSGRWPKWCGDRPYRGRALAGLSSDLWTQGSMSSPRPLLKRPWPSPGDWRHGICRPRDPSPRARRTAASQWDQAAALMGQALDLWRAVGSPPTRRWHSTRSVGCLRSG